VNAHAPRYVASLELPRRIERASRALAYIGLMIPLGALGLLAIAAIALGALVSIVGLGGPLALAVRAARRLAELDRRAANRLLDAHIPPLPGRARVAGGAWRRTRHALADRQVRLGLAALCLGGGEAVAMIVERVA